MIISNRKKSISNKVNLIQYLLQFTLNSNIVMVVKELIRNDGIKVLLQNLSHWTNTIIVNYLKLTQAVRRIL